MFPMTVCGLYIVQGIELRSSQTCMCHVNVAVDGDYKTAVTMAQEEVYQESLGIVLPGKATFWAARVHQGHVPCRHGLDTADMDVNEEEEIESHPTRSVFTVCGMYEDNMETYSEPWSAHGPLHAYYLAWKNVQEREDRYLLQACVHDGEIPGMMTFYAEPTAVEGPVMRDLMKDYDLL